MTSMRRNDVASTSFRRHVPTRFLTNQCQIITFLILKYDIIENSRIELRGIVLPVQVGGLLGGGGGAKGYVGPPPLSNYWEVLPPPTPPPPPHPTSYAYEVDLIPLACEDVAMLRGFSTFCVPAANCLGTIIWSSLKLPTVRKLHKPSLHVNKRLLFPLNMRRLIHLQLQL